MRKCKSLIVNSKQTERSIVAFSPFDNNERYLDSQVQKILLLSAVMLLAFLSNKMSEILEQK